MLRAWEQKGHSGTISVAKDTRTLSLNVLATAGFHQSYPFHSHDESHADEARSYRTSLATVLDNALLMMLAPPRLLSLPFAPASWQKIGQAVEDFRGHMSDMLNQERSSASQSAAGRGTLISSLVRASEDGEPNEVDSINRDRPTVRSLSLGEMLGNIFIINFAGHDTTANTLAYAMLMLAAYPHVQEWVAKEIRHVLGAQENDIQDYETAFPRLKRCFAVLVSYNT